MKSKREGKKRPREVEAEYAREEAIKGYENGKLYLSIY